MVGEAVAEHRPGIGTGHPDRARQDRRQYRAHIQSRADRLADLGEQLQFLDGAHQLGGAGSQFAEQSRIFDRDDRLRCEIFQQSDFFLGRLAYFMASQ